MSISFDDMNVLLDKLEAVDRKIGGDLIDRAVLRRLALSLAVQSPCAGGEAMTIRLPPAPKGAPLGRHVRCATCDAWYFDGEPDEIAEHAHVLPQGGGLRSRWIRSGLPWAIFHDTDDEARAWGHRDAKS